MAINRELIKPLPETLWVVWTFDDGVALDAPMEPENGSYRIYWSEKHAQNHVDRVSKPDTGKPILHTKTFEYVRNKQTGQS